MGARLVITGRNPERLAKVRSELQEGDHTAVEADLLVDADAARLVAGCGKLDGVVRLKRPGAAKLKVTALDPFGQPTSTTFAGDEIRLRPDTLYYSIEAP